MRGRTLNDSFIILDEAQNTTPEQMKMFLTRIGFGSRVVVTGDTTQVDVPNGKSGLAGLERTLTGIDGLAFVKLTGADVVRHRSSPTSSPRTSAAASRPSCPTLSEPPSPTARAAVVVVGADEQDEVDGRPRSVDEARRGVLEDEGRGGELTVTFVDHDDIAELNAEHMGKDGPTDVLSFPLDDGDPTSDPSPPRAGPAR